MRLAVSIVWLAIVVCLSLSPFEFKAHIHSMGRYHDLYHLVAFGITAVVLIWNARSLAARLRACLVAVAFALITELLERYCYHNPYEWRDVYTDCGGIVIGLILCTTATSLLPSRRPEF